MRILYVGRSAKIGGGSTFRYNIGRGLRSRGHEVWVASQPGEMVPRFRQAGVPFVWTPPAPWGGPWIEWAIRTHRIELVHASNATPGRAAEWACLRTGTPLVMSVHGLLGKKDHTATCLQRARRILTFEEVAVERLARHRELFDPGKILLLRRPIERRPHRPGETGPFRIVGVGRMSKRKGRNALNLIEAFRRFRGTVPEATLDVLGDGSILREVRRAAAECNLATGTESVRVHGAVPDPAPLVAGAHVLFGASYCALEAIMQGIAVVGAGFWGYGIISDENLREAMSWNFGDVGGPWEMTVDNFHHALLHLHGAWTGGPVSRAPYWGLDRLIREEHALENVVARIEAVYKEVLGELPEPAAISTAVVR